MSDPLHPTATEHLPAFITPPGQTDVLMVVMGVFLIFAVLMFGVVFFRLHTLPERMAHKSQKIQFEFVAILGLISLFTHMHIFWIAGLLLAVVDLPDFGHSLNRIAGSAEKIAGVPPGGGAVELPEEHIATSAPAEDPPKVPKATDVGSGAPAVPIRPEVVSAGKRS
jgi:hypothetical protein